jgi:hypothetical protein
VTLEWLDILIVTSLKACTFKGVKVFQLVVTLINAAQAIVGQSVAIQRVKENYVREHDEEEPRSAFQSARRCNGP